MKLIEFLKGKKTYIQSGSAIVVVGLWIFGVLDTVIAAQVLTALGFGSLISLRAGSKV